MKFVILLSLAVFACASSVEKRDANPEPGYGHHHGYHVPSYHPKVYHAPAHPYKYTPKYPVYGYGYGIHHHHKRSADPEPEPLASAEPQPEPSNTYYGKPSHYGHGYVKPVYHSYGYHAAPVYKSYSPYTSPYHHHSIHKRSAEPEPEPSKSYYGKPSYYGHGYVKPVYHSYGYHAAPVYKTYSPYPSPYYHHIIHKRSAAPEPEPSKAYYSKPSYYGHGYVKPVYHSYGYHAAPVYKSYSPYPSPYHHHIIHKRSAAPEPEPSKAYYSKPSYYGHGYVKPVYNSYGYHAAPVYKSYSPYPSPYHYHSIHKRSAEPEPEPSKPYGAYTPYKPYTPVYHTVKSHYNPYHYPKHGSYSYVHVNHG